MSLGSSLLAVMRSISKKYWKILHYAIIKADIKLRHCLSSPTFHVSRLKMHIRQICSHGFSGILTRNKFQNKCKHKKQNPRTTVIKEFTFSKTIGQEFRLYFINIYLWSTYKSLLLVFKNVSKNLSI